MNCRDSACQRFDAQFVPLAFLSAGSGVAGGGTFKVPVPDSRLRVKVSLIFVPNAGATLLSSLAAAAATIWLYDAEQDASGQSGIELPCANVEGTSAAPTAFPAANGLYGYAREFTTSADNIKGDWNATSFGVVHALVLQVRYAPDSVRFSPEEWDEITRRCTPGRTTPLLNL